MIMDLLAFARAVESDEEVRAPASAEESRLEGDGESGRGYLCDRRKSEQAIWMLEEQAQDPQKKADLVLLDLNIPRRDGTEVLTFISQHRQSH